MTLTRRDFLKLVGGTAGIMALRPFSRVMPLPDFPQGEHLGRLTATLGLVAAPRVDYPSIGTLYPDMIVPWLREVNAQTRDLYRVNQRWIETPQGYLYGAFVQPVRNLPNQPLNAIPDGKPGFWAEVTIPYVDLLIDNPPPRAPWAKDIIASGLFPRLYYSQVVWIDQIKTGDTGQILYRFNEDGGRPNGVTGGSFGDVFWADGSALRPLTPDDVAPITPDFDPNNKKVVVDTTYQTVSCMEGDREVYFCKCSTGYVVSGADKSTPLGEHTTWRKALSIHMSGGTTGAGYDTPAVSWTNLFGGATGVAIHAAFWHNNFGQPWSHGCVNVRPDDAKWIFRWTNPQLSLDNADVTVQMPGGTHVVVKERTF